MGVSLLIPTNFRRVGTPLQKTGGRMDYGALVEM